MGKFIDLTGRQFGRLTVLRRGPNTNEIRTRVQWECRCECGIEVLINGDNLKTGASESCGCLRKEVTARTRTTHGHTAHGKMSVEYRTWAGMIKRCYNPKAVGYVYYGARGIGVCARWQGQHGFEHFLADMGTKPIGPPRYTLERKDNEGHYEPSNCKWATYSEQVSNRRTLPRIKARTK